MLLSKARDTSSGPDDIHYQLLKHLPVSSLLIRLEILTIFGKPEIYLNLGRKQQ